MPEYSNYLHEAATKGLIVDSDSTKLLVIDGDFKHQDVYTVNVPFYGIGEAHIWMCDRFTFNLMRIYEEYPYIDLLGTIKMLRESTLGSNVQVYNSQKFYYLDDCLLMTYFETFK